MPESSKSSEHVKKSKKEQLDIAVDKKNDTIDQLRKRLPSRNNRVKTDPNTADKVRKQILELKTQIIDKRMEKRRLDMYSFLLARVKDEHEYQWFTYYGKRAVNLAYRGRAVVIKENDRFGVRPSSNGRNIRLILPQDKTRVLTISLEQAKRLANNVHPKVPK